MLEEFDEKEFSSIYAQADDLVFTTRGNSRKIIQKTVNRSAGLIKLKLSIGKCKYMIVGGKMIRTPTIKIGNNSIKITTNLEIKTGSIH